MAFLFKLKLLNGPLIGRELELPAGPLILGQGQEADLHLPLEDGLTRVALLVSETGLQLSSNDAQVPCWVAGQPWQTPEAPFPLEQVIDIAGQALLLGQMDSTLAFCTVPVRQTDGQRAKKARVERRWGLWASVALIVLVAVAGGVAWQFKATGAFKSASERDQIKLWLSQQRTTPAYSALDFEWQSDGTLTINGRCRESSQLTPLLNTLRQQQIFVREKVVCDDQLRRNVEYVLHLFGYQEVTVHGTDQPGQVAIKGAIQADDRWRNVVDMLAVMPGLEAWHVVDHSDEQLQKLLAQLRKNDLLKKLSVVRSKEALVVSGQLEAPQQKQLEALLTTFRQQWDPAPKIIYQNIRPSKAQSDLFPSPIVSVGGNLRAPFVELANGVRLQVGARLPSGYQIVHIDSNCGIELSREGRLVHVPLNL